MKYTYSNWLADNADRVKKNSTSTKSKREPIKVEIKPVPASELINADAFNAEMEVVFNDTVVIEPKEVIENEIEKEVETESEDEVEAEAEDEVKEEVEEEKHTRRYNYSYSKTKEEE